jgi:hypothetical protein
MIVAHGCALYLLVLLALYRARRRR